MTGRYPFPAVPDGWFAIAASSSIVTGELTTLHYLDRELVAYRGGDGRVRVFDAYCPHLGAHLGVGGRVCADDGLVCPFHGWHFDGDGRLVEVPRLDRRPPQVSARTYPVRELNDRVFVWHHAQDAPPGYDLLPYRVDGPWTPWRVDTYRVRIHVQELSENIIDRSHFYEVHDMIPPDEDLFDVRFDAHVMTVDQNIKVTALSEAGVEVRTRTTVSGPGVVAVEVQEGPLNMLTYITQTPVDEQTSEITICFSMAALDDADFTATVAEMNARITNLQFTQDVPIWENKIYRARPRLTAQDGPISAYRHWFAQFYSTPT